MLFVLDQMVRSDRRNHRRMVVMPCTTTSSLHTQDVDPVERLEGRWLLYFIGAHVFLELCLKLHFKYYCIVFHIGILIVIMKIKHDFFKTL
jgi:hypothetical protein